MRLSSLSATALIGSLALILMRCAQPEAPEPALKMPRAIVDLSPTIGEDFPVVALGEKAVASFGIAPRTTFDLNIIEEPFYAGEAVYCLANHVGPHYDPPSHVIKGAKSSDQAPLDRFYGKAKLFDFRSKPKDEPLLRADFENRGIEPGDIVLVAVGYQAPTSPEELPSYAYLSAEAAEYLARIPIKAFASDMPSLGSMKGYMKLMEQGLTGSENILPEHISFLSREIPNIEGLVNLESLVGEEQIVFAGFPLKIRDGNGAPMRAAALVY
jgi:kynurenine formamidase